MGREIYDIINDMADKYIADAETTRGVGKTVLRKYCI